MLGVRHSALTLPAVSIALCFLTSSTLASIVVLSSGGATSNGSRVVLGQPIIGRASNPNVKVALGFLPCTTVRCPADFDGTGFVDTDDFTAFVLAFEAGTDDADFDGTGFVDTDDFTAFMLAFEAGC